MDTARIWSNSSQLKALTGLEMDEAKELVENFRCELSCMGHVHGTLGGRPPKHSPEGIFLMLMMYYRHYLTLEALGALFDLNDSNVKRWITDSENALRQILEKKSLSHLIAKPPSKSSLKSSHARKNSISMALNNLYADL